MNISKNRFRIVRIGMTAGMLVLAVWYVFTHHQDLSVILTISRGDIVLLLFASILKMLVNAAQCAYVYRGLGVAISVWESLYLSAVSGTVGLFVSQGTTITKTIYLKTKHAVPISQAPAIFLVLLVELFAVGALMMTCYIAIAAVQGVKVPVIYWLIVIGAGISMLFLCVDFPADMRLFPVRINRMLQLFATGWKRLRLNRPLLVMSSLFQIFSFIAAGWRIYLAYHALGMPLGLIAAIGIAIFVAFSGLLMLTPGNLGIQEAAYGYITWTCGFSFAHGVAVSALIRGIDLVVTLIIAPLGWYHLFYRQGAHISKSSLLASQQEAVDEGIVSSSTNIWVRK